jgi:glycosyltransferase involved in cell wall biosynthesis
MNLAWFSPMVPVHSEIANFTGRLQPELSRQFDGARFLTEQAAGFFEPATSLSYPCEFGHTPHTLLPSLAGVDVPVYHIGNNPDFHAKTWFLSQQKPGIIVLHDLKLHHFFEGIYRDRLYDQPAYLAIMRRYYGEPGYEAGLAWWRQEIPITFLAEQFPMTAWAVENALAVVVHTAHARDRVALETGTPVWHLPLAYASRSNPPKAAGPPTPWDGGPFPRGRRARLAIFGYLNINRRIVEFLGALALMPERERFEVHFYGMLFRQAEVEAAVARLGLGGQVVFHGYLPEEELEAGLAEADLAINLRFPTMGEASSSQLRIWDHALPSLVTRIDGYADLPADSVDFVRPEFERRDIEHHLRHFLAQPGFFRQKGLRGRQRLLEAHSPAAYAAELRALCEVHLDALRTRYNRLALAGRVGRLLPAWEDRHLAATRERFHAGRIMELLQCPGQKNPGGSPANGRPPLFACGAGIST